MNSQWEVFAFFALIMIGYFGLALKMLLDSKKKEKKFLNKLDSEWGKIPTREYSYEEFEVISHYFINSDKEGFFVDDITWNDLDMDQVFQNINATYSSVGQEYLYDMIRRPVFDTKLLEERNYLIEHFAKEKEERKLIQLNCAKLGRMKLLSITDYLENLLDLEQGGNLSGYAANFLLIVAVVCLFLKPSIGVLAVVGALVYSGYSHYIKKQKIDAYITSFGYIIKLLNSSKVLTKELGLRTKELDTYLDKMREAQKHLQKFQKRSFLLITGNNLTGGGPEVLILDYIRIFTHVDLIKFNQMLKEVRENLSWIKILFDTYGLLESAVAIASYRESLPYYDVPKLTTNHKLYIKATQLYHPLITEPVANDIHVNQGVLITGSNASGKSTFLKTVAINQILAQSIVTSVAKSYEANYFKVYSSMSLQDNLQNKESYFMVEIKSLKRILDSTKEYPILCFVDEVLRGTNTVERIAASAQILKSLATNPQILCFAATHDIELTHLLDHYFENFHFKEKIVENDIIFDYHLLDSRATSRNAIQLLRIMGYDDRIIEDAEETAQSFLESGEWKLITKRMEA